MKTIKKIADIIDKIIEYIGTGIVLFIFVANVMQVVVRKMGGTLSWADEVSRHLMLLLIVFGAALGARKGTAIRVTVLLNRLPAKARKWVELVQYGIVFIFSVITTYSMYLGCIGLGNQTLNMLTSIKLSWIYWILFGGFVLMDINLILYMISVFQGEVDLSPEAELKMEEDMFLEGGVNEGGDN